MRNWINFMSHHSFGPSRCDLPVFAAMLSRRKWPLDKYCSPKLSAILLDIVPFPDPGGPIIAARNNLAMSSPSETTLRLQNPVNTHASCSCLCAMERNSNNKKTLVTKLQTSYYFTNSYQRCPKPVWH